MLLTRPLLLTAIFFSVTLPLSPRDGLGDKYVEASDLTLVGKMMPTANPYHRVDTTVYKGFTELESLEVRSPAGMAVAFITDSPSITVESVFGDERKASYTMLQASRGYDLYVKVADAWKWAASGALTPDEKDCPCNLISGLDRTRKEFLLYLPMFTELLSCRIGVERGSSIEPSPDPFRHRVVFYGSSFTQGTGTARSGMAYPLQFERRTGIQAISLGMGARCLMQDYVAAVLADVEADAFVFDTFSNPPVEMIEDRLFPFIERIREAHPGVPLIFQQTILTEGSAFSPERRRNELARMARVEQLMKTAVSRYDDVFFIHPDPSGSPYAATPDGLHPDDAGYCRWAESIRKPILKILKKYNID